MSGGGRIGALVAKLEAMSHPEWREGLARQMGEETQRLYKRDFDKQVDPYGKPWAPSFDVASEQYNRKKRFTQKTLIKTGYLRASGEVEVVNSTGFRFRVYAPYGQFHQTGTRRIPRRMIVPSSALGLGTWGAPLNRIAVQAIRGLMK